VGESAHALSRLGQSVTVLTTDIALAPAGPLQRQRRLRAEDRHPSLADGDVRVHRARFPRRLAYSPELARSARRLAPGSHVIHLHNLWQHPQYAGYVAARGAGVPYIVSTHGALDPYIRAHGAARKRLFTVLYQHRLLQGARLIHVTTAAEARYVNDVLPEASCEIVPCGTDTARFAQLPPGTEFRRRHLRDYDGRVILFLGRITYKKGLDVLVEAFAEVRRSLDCRLVVAGPDDESLSPALMTLAARLDVADDVTFTGPLYGEQRLAALASADVWALASHAENFGIAVVEAMAAARPVVISRGVSLAADVEAAGAGVVAEAAPQPFAREIAALLSDDARREMLGRRARAYAARYDWDVVGPQLLDMYQRVASGS
jgi:glycosyltransferase involved in cell wall biosynthesis